jgi:glycosyltransferase involved in cell wall biosynthesis
MRLIRIGVDISGFRIGQAGVARYVQNMLANMMTIAPEMEFVLYSAWPVEISLSEGRWRLRTDSGLRGMSVSYWIQHCLPKWLAEDKIDVFWGQNHLLPVRLKRPCWRLLTLHDMTGVLYPWTMPLWRRLNSRIHLRKAVRVADRVIAVSRATARLGHSLLGVRSDKLVVIHEGVGQGLGPIPPDEANRRVGERFGLSPGYLLTVSTIEPRKDHLTLLRALRRVSGAPQLVIVGGLGWKCRAIMRGIEHEAACGRVRYLGRVSDDDLPALYSAAKLMVYPSLYEGFGLPVLEAMACGCPVLCSWTSSLPEVGGSAARYFRTHDEQHLFLRLRELLADDTLLRQMAAEGMRQVRKFSFRRAASEVLLLIEEGHHEMWRDERRTECTCPVAIRQSGRSTDNPTPDSGTHEVELK